MGATAAAFICGSVGCGSEVSTNASPQHKLCFRRRTAFVCAAYTLGTSTWVNTSSQAPLQRVRSDRRPRWTALLGGGGFLGVGPSEMVVVFAVGWLILGPQKLFALSRDVGRVVGDIKKSADEASSTFKEAMEMEALANEIKEEEAKLGAAGKGSDEEGDEDEDEDAKEGDLDLGEESSTRGLAGSGEDNVDESDVSEVLKGISESMSATSGAGAATGDGAGVVADRTAVTPPSLPDLEMPGPGSQPEEANDAALTRARFLEQLNRSQDPNQTADFDVNGERGDQAMEEEVEVARLEYELAKARLAAKQKRNAEPSSGGKTTGA